MIFRDDLLKKLVHNDRQEWRGYLTSDEIAYLLDEGCVLSMRSVSLYRRVVELKTKQNANHAWWFYFIPAASLGLKMEYFDDAYPA